MSVKKRGANKMSRIYKHGQYTSDLTMDNVKKIVDVVETYLCNYKLAFHLVYQRRHLIRMDICELGSKSVIASYSFRYETLTLFKRKVFHGVMLTDYEHERSKLLSLYNECLSLMRFKCLLFMNVLSDEGGC